MEQKRAIKHQETDANLEIRYTSIHSSSHFKITLNFLRSLAVLHDLRKPEKEEIHSKETVQKTMSKCYLNKPKDSFFSGNSYNHRKIYKRVS